VAGEGLQAVVHPGEAGRRVNHALLVAGQVVGQLRTSGQLGLEQGLTHARNIAVTEDAEASRDEPALDAVPLAVLAGQEPDRRLGDGEPYRHSPTSLSAVFAVVSGKRGSTVIPSQLSRIQACRGSSEKRQTRSPGPAMTFR